MAERIRSKFTPDTTGVRITRRGILIAAVCPGLIDTGASRRWLDTTRAQTPAEAAGGLLDLALGPDPDPGFYGELVLFGKVVPWKP